MSEPKDGGPAFPAGVARFNGDVYDPVYDDERLTKQIGRVWDAMIDGRWRTLAEIEALTRDPQASISAQLRHLRKPRFGAYLVDKRPRGDRSSGLFEYRVRERDWQRDPLEQKELFGGKHALR